MQRLSQMYAGKNVIAVLRAILLKYIVCCDFSKNAVKSHLWLHQVSFAASWLLVRIALKKAGKKTDQKDFVNARRPQA